MTGSLDRILEVDNFQATKVQRSRSVLTQPGGKGSNVARVFRQLGGEVVLFPDHSVSNWRGEKKPSYKWDLQPDGLMITWLKGYNWFPRLAGPGIYEGFRDGHPVRIEKQQ